VANLITEYGLHWEADKVEWGRGAANPREILGVEANRLRSPETDFAPRAAIYVLQTERFEVVHIGQAGKGKRTSLGPLLGEHRRDELAHRWTLFSWFGVASGVGTVSKTLALHQMEAMLIATADPRLKLRQGRWHGALEFVQHSR